MSIAFISHPDCARHEMGAHHPESPARLSAIQDQLLASGLEFALRNYEAPLATREQLYQVHDKEYVDDIFARAPKDYGQIWLDPDTSMMADSLNAALRAAGAMVLGVELVMSGKEQAAFCNVRPPGHHAERARTMGFCIFNNVAVGAAIARDSFGVKRLAILDFDVHHGNGTEDIFQDEPNVLFCSTFQHPFYPHTGADVISEHIVNAPLAAGANGAAFKEAVNSHWLPKLHEFQPELVLISAGFDAHIEDDMASLCLTERDYSWVTREIKTIADTYAQGRIVSTLEGGYALSALGRSVVAHLNALLG
jgi:acetoin utilization deacetylase AcuC-like enzyme